MFSSVVRVTPQLAEEWLQKNTANRPRSRSTIEQLAKQINRGEWKLTHQGIAFDEDGMLLDGQHRLYAVIRAGTPVDMMVFQGVPRETFAVLDTGRKRTGKDVLSLANEANAAHLASALRGLHLYYSAPEMPWSGGRSVVSNEQLIELLEEHPRMREAVSRGFKVQSSIQMTVTAAAIGWYVTSSSRPDIDQDPWLDGVLTGANLSPGDPRLTLRNTIMSLKSGRYVRRREDSQQHLHYYIKAWNAWVEGKEQKLLRRSAQEKMAKPTKKPAAAVYGAGPAMVPAQ